MHSHHVLEQIKAEHSQGFKHPLLLDADLDAPYRERLVLIVSSQTPWRRAPPGSSLSSHKAIWSDLAMDSLGLSLDLGAKTMT